MDAPCHLTDLPVDIKLPLVQKLDAHDRIQFFSTCKTLNNCGMEICFSKTCNPELKKVIWNQITFQSEVELFRFNLLIVKLVGYFQKFCHSKDKNSENLKQLSQYIAEKVDHINPQPRLIIGAPEYYWFEEYNHISLHLILRWLHNYATDQISSTREEIDSDQTSYELIQEYLSIMRRYLFENSTDDRLHRAEIDLYASLFLYWQPLKNSLDRKATDICWTVRTKTTTLCPVNVRFINLDENFSPSFLYEVILNKYPDSVLLPIWTFNILLKDAFAVASENESDSEYEYLPDGTVQKISQKTFEVEHESLLKNDFVFSFSPPWTFGTLLKNINTPSKSDSDEY
jgi:hypothetical protein